MYINMCVCVCLKSINNINYSNIYYMLTGFVSKGKNMIKLLWAHFTDFFVNPFFGDYWKKLPGYFLQFQSIC